MRIRQIDEEGSAAAVQMAPLIDCVFLLLTFFLVTSALREIHRELPLEMPDRGAASKAKAPDPVLVISIAKDGLIHMAGEPVTLQVLHQKLRAASQQPNVRVLIEGDRAAAFQHITYVLDLCEFEGLKNVGVQTRD